MNEFEKMIAETVSNKLSDGTVEKLIEQKIEEAIKKSYDIIIDYINLDFNELQNKYNKR